MKASNITLKLSVVLFKEDGTFIAYCPALDLSGYGKTESEAKKSFEIVLNEFLKYTANKNTLEDELKKLGWVKKSEHSKKLTPPDFVDIINKNKELQRVVNNNPIKTYNKAIPLYA